MDTIVLKNSVTELLTITQKACYLQKNESLNDTVESPFMNLNFSFEYQWSKEQLGYSPVTVVLIWLGVQVP